MKKGWLKTASPEGNQNKTIQVSFALPIYFLEQTFFDLTKSKTIALSAIASASDAESMVPGPNPPIHFNGAR
jgi:hypothetical protein